MVVYQSSRYHTVTTYPTLLERIISIGYILSSMIATVIILVTTYWFLASL